MRERKVDWVIENDKATYIWYSEIDFFSIASITSSNRVGCLSFLHKYLLNSALSCLAYNLPLPLTSLPKNIPNIMFYAVTRNLYHL